MKIYCFMEVLEQEKHFCSHCITKELIDKGSFVVYRTAEELIKALKDIRFNNNSSLEEFTNKLRLTYYRRFRH